MSRTISGTKHITSALAAAFFGAAVAASGQTPAPPKTAAWVPARLADGQPNIQGIYARGGIYGLAPQELEANGPHGAGNPLDDSAFNRQPFGEDRPKRARVVEDDPVQGEGARSVPLAGPGPTPARKLGLVDPPNKILPWIPEEDRKRREFLLKTVPPASLRYIEFDARCALPGLFLNGGPYQFVQPDKELVILSEYSHYTRTIHLDGRPHLSSSIRLFMGDSVGHWEGNTLIVDTTNFNEFTSFTREIPYLSDALHTIERFTVVDENNIDYEVTIDDPKLFTAPWKTVGLYRKAKKGSYELTEYGCADPPVHNAC